MKNNDRDSYGITVKSDYGRAILPEKIIDVGRYDVTIEENGEISGGVMCTNITATTPFNIAGSVLSMDTVRVTVKNGLGLFKGPINATRSFLVAGGEKNSTACRMIGDVSGNSITLNNSVIYGNILGNKVVLKNCLVFGEVHASSYLELDNCFVFSFIADKVKMCSDTYILNLSSRFDDTIEQEGKLYSLAMTSIANMNLDNLVELTKEDIVRSTHNGAVLQIISCFNRITSLESVEMQIKENLLWFENLLISYVTTEDNDIADAAEKIIRKIMT